MNHKNNQRLSTYIHTVACEDDIYPTMTIRVTMPVNKAIMKRITYTVDNPQSKTEMGIYGLSRR